MPNTGPIVVVEDDIDDQEILTDILRETGVENEIIFFDECCDAYNYLKITVKQPFIILCDINLPKMNGLEFKSQVDNDHQLRQKSIPFIFFSTAAPQAVVREAFTKLTVQGFFQKSDSIEDLKRSLQVIIDYWTLCKHPNLGE